MNYLDIPKYKETPNIVEHKSKTEQP